MARSLCPDRLRVTIMAAATIAVLLLTTVWSQLLVLLIAGLFSVLLIKPADDQQPAFQASPVSRRAGSLALGVFVVLLVGLPLLATLMPSQVLAMIDSFYRVGSLVFGGGHVVLPLLQAETVDTGLVDVELFLAGYGATQAVPGPLFTFAAFLGAAMDTGLPGWLNGLLDRKSTRLNSSHVRISYAVFCLKKKKK